jgi:hypothetical protein
MSEAHTKYTQARTFRFEFRFPKGEFETEFENKLHTQAAT